MNQTTHNSVVAVAGIWHEGSVAHLHNTSLSYLATERVTRKKYAGLTDPDSLKLLLQSMQIDTNSVDTYIWVGTQNYHNTHIHGHELQDYFESLSQGKTHLLLDHHMAHQASSYYTSNFDEALVLSIDDVGDGLSGRLAIGRGDTLTQIDQMDAQFSLGRLWEAVNILLGFSGANDSGKTMALTAWGKTPRYLPFLNNLVRYDSYFPQFADSEKNPPQLHQMFGNTFNGNAVLANYLSVQLDIPFASPLLHTYLGKTPPAEFAHIFEDYYDLVLSIQEFTSQTIAKIIQNAAKKYGINNVCLAGGVSLNGVSNTHLLEQSEVHNLHVPPMVSDCGLSIGGVLWVKNMLEKKSFRTAHPFIPYSGPAFTSAIEGVLHKYQKDIEIMHPESIEKTTAQLLSEGNIIGWYQGQSEIGPRALGNRSILAHPGKAGMKDRINHIIKKRESFRPFAPSVLAEHAHVYFELSEKLRESPYMLFIAPVKTDKQELVREIMHEDKTGRLQTVHKEINPKYHNLINEFYSLTGIPLILNTSFNDNAEPIVHTPEDAMICFLENNIDYLVLEDVLIKPKKHLSTS
jgi:carbamoyltransferase